MRWVVTRFLAKFLALLPRPQYYHAAAYRVPSLSHHHFNSSNILITLRRLNATCASTILNYLFYRRFFVWVVYHARYKKKKKKRARDRSSVFGSIIRSFYSSSTFYSHNKLTFSTSTLRATLDVSDFWKRCFLIACQSHRRGALVNYFIYIALLGSFKRYFDNIRCRVISNK